MNPYKPLYPVLIISLLWLSLLIGLSTTPVRAATDRPFSVNIPFFENNLELVEALVRRGGVRVLTLGG